MSNITTIRVHTSETSAAAIKAVGQQLIVAKWKQTKNQERKERCILLGIESLQAPEVPEQFRALVESALRESAQEVLKKQSEQDPNRLELDLNLFTRTALVESFMTRADNWMSKDDLEREFMASQTWKRFNTRPDFSTNPAVFKAATLFKESVLKLSGKASYLEQKLRDQILARIAEEDLESEWGSFLVRRFEQMQKKDAVECVDLSAL